MKSTSLATKPHYPILDGLRGVASILVVIFHILEAHSTSHLDLMINHGYLAVDFFFLLSGFVIGYAYDDRWKKMTPGDFFKRRLVRLHPMVIMGMIVGALGFYFQDSAMWPAIHTIPVWKMLLIMVIGFTLIPVPTSMDIRGWQEMHPLDGPAWSLFFEYVANILYALFIRKFSRTALWVLVILSGAALVHYLLTGGAGDVIGGWAFNPEQLRIGFTRLMYPFCAGLLLSRTAHLTRIGNAFLWCSLLLVVVFAIPRIGGADHLWMNGLYESFVILFVFPLVVYLGASARISQGFSSRICKFFGDISYPIYITHYPLVYIYTGWVSNHKGVGFRQAFPYALATFFGAVIIAYACLKLYDEPVRNWLQRRWLRPRAEERQKLVA
ncbi:MAG: acyltransferase [Chitinophagaceae bacterium]|nr:acyltransferase [Chitinophagaceae bacterium]